ncbi:MAG: hypothetical protein QOJ35_3906, partial [Solirubrobacteraceae bacterium]|nr:hypothetical protein [Solirubrobacteraceae bacterium]
DVLILGLLVGVFAVTDGRPGRMWVLLGAVFAGQAVVDTVYLYEAASGRYAFGTLLDTTWPALMLLLAVTAWHAPAVRKSAADQRWGTLALTTACAVVGLFVVAYDNWTQIDDVSVVLATLTLVAAFVRTTMRFAEIRALADGRELSLWNELILDAAGDGIVGTDARGRITFVNPAGARMIGHAPGELRGRDAHKVMHHTRPDGSPYPVRECPTHMALQDGKVRHCDQDLYWRKDGTSFAVEYTCTPIVDGGRILGAVAVFHDISERRELERVKDEFTSVVSHELRTPLTSIRGSLGLLESGVLGPLPDGAQRMIQIAVQNTDRLVRLINDILDLERLDSDAMHLRDCTCDAAQLIAGATEAMLPAAVAADVTLTVDAVPAAFQGDPDRLIQTLTNLIGNAVKFSPPGGTVQISSERRSDEILFSVRDGGRGIPADKLETIFGRFQQIDSSDSRQNGGTGLGLAISRSIVEHHGGRIWALSAPDAGSTFSFSVPAAPGPAGEYTPRPGGARASVLICDDNAEILEVTGTALEARGFRVILARSGEEAIERAIAERPDAILLDLILPGMSGARTAAALRGHAETRGIPVVALSVLPRSDEELARGRFADWIEKPATPTQLVAALDRAIGPRDDTFRVLCVEGDPTVAGLLGALFGRHAVASFAATDGHGAVELCEHIHPDLIVVDDALPDLDGVQMADWLRLHEHLCAVPIVGFDARDVEDAECDRRSLGAVAQILTKGKVTPEAFQWHVMTLLARPRGRRRAAEADHDLEAHPAHR